MMCIWWSVIFMVSLSEFPLSACVFPVQVLCPMNHSLSVPLHCIYFTYEQIRNPTWCATNKHDGKRLLRGKQLSWDFKGNFYFNVKPSGNRTHKHTHKQLNTQPGFLHSWLHINVGLTFAKVVQQQDCCNSLFCSCFGAMHSTIVSWRKKWIIREERVQGSHKKTPQHHPAVFIDREIIYIEIQKFTWRLGSLTFLHTEKEGFIKILNVSCFTVIVIAQRWTVV